MGDRYSFLSQVHEDRGVHPDPQLSPEQILQNFVRVRKVASGIGRFLEAGDEFPLVEVPDPSGLTGTIPLHIEVIRRQYSDETAHGTALEDDMTISTPLIVSTPSVTNPDKEIEIGYVATTLGPKMHESHRTTWIDGVQAVSTNGRGADLVTDLQIHRTPEAMEFIGLLESYLDNTK